MIVPLYEQLDRLRSNLISEEKEFGDHIRKWFPISVLIGIVVGFAMTLFTIFISFIAWLMGGIFPLLAMLIGGGLIILLVRWGIEDTETNGITYVIGRKHQRKGVPLEQSSEFLAAGLSIGSGLPVGREAPALIIGSALATRIASWRGIGEDEIDEAITVGSAAATGALFQAPFGSAVFAAEVPYKEDSDEPILMVSFLASVVAAVTLRTLITIVNELGFIVDLHIFRIGEAFLEVNILNSLLAFLLGLLIGLMGRGVVDVFYRYQKQMKRRFAEQQRLLIGLLLSLLSLAMGLLLIEDFYLAEGISSFDQISNFIGGDSDNYLLILFGAMVIQIIATVAIIAVGFPGGIFSPTLSVGAISGLIFADVLGITELAQVTAFAIVGMSASHAAFTKTPIASILLVLEITNMPSLIIPLILANIAAYVVSGHRSLYEGQMRSRDATLLKQLAQYDQFTEVTIEAIMTPDEKVIFATPNTLLQEILERAENTGKRTFPVLEDKKVVGIISYNDINKGIENGKTEVKEAMTKDVVKVHKDMDAREALSRFLAKDVERVPVVDENNILQGIVTLHDILLGHEKLIHLNRTFGGI